MGVGGGGERNNVTSYPPDAAGINADISGSVWRQGISGDGKWTIGHFLSAGFDVGEEAGGGSRTTAAPGEGRRQNHQNMHQRGRRRARTEERGIKEKHDDEGGRGRGRRPPLRMVFKHLPGPAYAGGEKWLFDSITLLLQL